MNYKTRIKKLSSGQKQLFLQRIFDSLDGESETSSMHLQLSAHIKTEPGRQLPDIKEIRSYLSEKLPDYMIPAHFHPIQDFPRTPNGKVDRIKLTDRPISPIETSEPPIEDKKNETNERASALLDIWRKVLGNTDITIHDNFFEVGGDSILAIQIISQATQAEIELTVTELFETPTVADLTSTENTFEELESEEIMDASSGTEIVTGAVAFTPIQYWWLDQKLADYNHWNQSVLLKLYPAISSGMVRNSLEKLLEHHDMLRLVVQKNHHGWSQFIRPPIEETIKLETVDLSSTSESEGDEVILEYIDRLHESVSIHSGCMLEAAYLKTGKGQSNMLALVIHHMAVDGISWNILLRDLDTLLRQHIREEAIILPSKTCSYKEWADALTLYSKDSVDATEILFWKEQPYSECPELPLDFPGLNDNLEGSSGLSSVSWSKKETEAFQDAVSRKNHSIQEVLLASTVLSLCNWTQEPSMLVGIESHGRVDSIGNLNTSSTVGWFTSYYPLVLRIQPSTDFDTSINSVTTQAKAVPNKGIAFGMLKYLHTGINNFDEIPEPKVIFNYLGRQENSVNSLETISVEERGIGSGRHPLSSRSSVFEINTVIQNGKLKLNWIFSKNLHKKDTVEELLHTCKKHIDTYLQEKQPVMDNSHSGLSKKDLESLLNEIG